MINIFLIKKARHLIFGTFFIFIHMTRFYTKNSQLNSTNLHSWGMLKKNSTKKPSFGDPRFQHFTVQGRRELGEASKSLSKKKWLKFHIPSPHRIQMVSVIYNSSFSAVVFCENKNQKTLKAGRNEILSSKGSSVEKNNEWAKPISIISAVD